MKGYCLPKKAYLISLRDIARSSDEGGPGDNTGASPMLGNSSGALGLLHLSPGRSGRSEGGLNISVYERFLRIAWIYKLFLAGGLFGGGVYAHANDSLITDAGIRAALMGVCAAGVLFVDMLPNTGGPYGAIATGFVRLGGALLTVGAGWHWVASTTDGEPWRYLWPMLLVILLMAPGMVGGALMSVFVVQPRQTRPDQWHAMLTALGGEAERFREAMSDDKTRPDEIAGIVLALEIQLANLFMFLRYDPKSGFGRKDLARLLRYADTPTSNSSIADASRGHFRRVRAYVRSVIDEP